MAYSLIKYDWAVEAEPVSADASGKAYIGVYYYCDQPLYFLYTREGRFEGLYWSESEARIQAAAKGMECEDGLRRHSFGGILDSVARNSFFGSVNNLVL